MSSLLITAPLANNYMKYLKDQSWFENLFHESRKILLALFCVAPPKIGKCLINVLKKSHL